MIGSALLLALLSPVTLDAADSLYVCPAEIAASWNIPSVPEGWETLRATAVVRHWLQSATFSDGHPQGQAFLKPYSAGANAPGKKGTRREVYRFPAEYPDGIWLVCRYHDTPAIVFKRLPDTPRSCEVAQSPKAGSPLEQTIRCR